MQIHLAQPKLPLRPPLHHGRILIVFILVGVAAGLIWPGANLAVSAYEDAGFVALAVFMSFVFALALGLGVLSVKLLASRDGEK